MSNTEVLNQLFDRWNRLPEDERHQVSDTIVARVVGSIICRPLTDVELISILRRSLPKVPTLKKTEMEVA